MESVDAARHDVSRAARLPWPIITRDEEDRAVALVADHRRSVVLVGPPGVGKTVVGTRITDRVLARSTGRATRVVPVRGTADDAAAAFTSMLARVGSLPADGAADDVGAEHGRRLAADLDDPNVVIRIDAADQLDPVAGRHLAWLVRYAHVRVVLLCRDFTALAEPLRDLWQEDLLERIDLEPFDVATTGVLLERALEAPLECASLVRLHTATQGIPLHLREVVRAGAVSGALAPTTSGWYWRGRVTVPNSLTDVYRTELSHLPERLRDVVDLVALADPIPLSRLLALVGDVDVDRVVALGLVTVDVDAATGSTPVVRPSHPLVGEVVRSLVPVARRTRLFARANAFHEVPADGGPPIDELLDAASVAVRVQDYDSACVLASAALSGRGITTAASVTALCLRATALGYSVGREAARIDAQQAWCLARTAAGTIDDDLVVEAVEVHADVHQFLDDDADAAVALMDEAAAVVGQDARERLRLLRLAHLGWAGRFTEVLAETDRSGVLGGPVPVEFLVIAPCAVVALGGVGRLPEALALGSAALATAVANADDDPCSTGEISAAMHQVQVWAGDGEHLIVEVPVRQMGPLVKDEHTFELVAGGNLAVVERRWEDARAAFATACERFAVLDPGGFLAYPRARLALALAMLGRTAEASAAVDLAAATPLRGARLVLEEVPATIAYTEMVLGRPVALEHVSEIAQRSERSGARGAALFALALQLRLESELGRDVTALGARIRAVGPGVQSPIAEAFLMHLEAVERQDEKAARDARDRLAGFGFPLGAAKRGRPTLTRREYEVAELAAQGLSNREIAERLGRSVRTIDAHVARIFSKWDLHSRRELVGML